jgi:hypothetical protein
MGGRVGERAGIGGKRISDNARIAGFASIDGNGDRRYNPASQLT